MPALFDFAAFDIVCDLLPDRDDIAEKRLATPGQDGHFELFRARAQILKVFPSTQPLIDHARAVVLRELTLCERKRYFLSVPDMAENCPK